MTTPTTASRSRTRTPSVPMNRAVIVVPVSRPMTGRDADEDGAGRASEPQLGQGMDGERHVARNDEAADDARHDRDHDPGRDGVLGEVVAKQVDHLVDHRTVFSGRARRVVIDRGQVMRLLELETRSRTYR